MNVARAVEILTGARAPQYELEREFAVLAFSGWLNWPKESYAPAHLSSEYPERRLTRCEICFG